MKTANKTDIGRIRYANEDRSVVLNELNGFTVAIVADGMGGHQAGDVASQTAVEKVTAELQSSLRPEMTVEERKQLLERSIAAANETVFVMSVSDEKLRSMGTTIVVAIASPDTIVIGHIGDSRAYLISGDTIEQMTDDHTLVNELVKSGQITIEESLHHPRRNVLTRALGTEKESECDIREIGWAEGEMLLICSDGLSNMVTSSQMLETVQKPAGVDEKADKLVQLALEAGGDDNITIVLLVNENEPAQSTHMEQTLDLSNPDGSLHKDSTEEG